MDISHSLSLTNPLTIEFEYLRRSLIPGLLMDLENNQGRVGLPVRIFELSNIYLPEERSILGIATQGESYRHAKGYLEALLQTLHLENVHYQNQADESGPWQKNQTAEIYSGKHFIGIFGAIKPEVKAAFNIAGDIYLANLDFQTISNLANANFTYTPLSDYPDLIEDITIQSGLHISELIQLIKQESKLVTKVTYKDSLKNKHTFTIHFNDSKRNLTQEEVNKIKASVLRQLGKASGKSNLD